MNPGMPKGANPKLYLGIHVRLVSLKKEDGRAVLDLMRWFSATTRYAYNRLLEGKTREELKQENGSLCTLFGLNTRYADGAIEKAQATSEEAGKRAFRALHGARRGLPMEGTPPAPIPGGS